MFVFRFQKILDGGTDNHMTSLLAYAGVGDYAMKHTLTVMPTPEIDQADLAPIVARRNVARKLVRELRADGLRMLRLIEKGSHVEPGIHTAEVHECSCRGKITKRLMVDGRPVEDW